MPPKRKNAAIYAGLVAAAALLGVLASWFVNPYLDNYAYDFFFRLYRPQPWRPQSAILAIDEKRYRNTAVWTASARRWPTA